MEKRLKNIQTFEQKTSELNISDVIVCFKDEDDIIREVSLDDIIDNIGFDYNIDVDVMKLRNMKNIINIRVNGIIVWKS